jgi:hypothetical protein
VNPDGPARPVRVPVRVPRRLYAELERVAARTQTTVGQVLLELADTYVAERRCRHGAAPAVPEPEAPA